MKKPAGKAPTGLRFPSLNHHKRQFALALPR